MESWSLAHPYLAFSLAIFCLAIINNIVLALRHNASVQKKESQNEVDSKGDTP